MDSRLNFSGKIAQGLNHLHFKSISSTNDFLEDLVLKENLKNGFVISADFQTMGRGMLNNSWFSESGKNLLFSRLYLPNHLEVQFQFFLSKVVASGVRNGIQQLLPGENVKIKWPNDIYVNTKKIAGILIKNHLKNKSIQQSILGIGINVNQQHFPAELNATSIATQTGKYSSVNQVFDIISEHLDEALGRLELANYEFINKNYHDNLLGLGTWMTYLHRGHSFEAKILEVTAEGQLLLEDRYGKKTGYEVKEIALVSVQPV